MSAEQYLDTHFLSSELPLLLLDKEKPLADFTHDPQSRLAEQPTSLVRNLEGIGFSVPAEGEELTRQMVMALAGQQSQELAIERFIKTSSESIKHWSREYAFHRPVFGYWMKPFEGTLVIPAFDSKRLPDITGSEERDGLVKQRMYQIEELMNRPGTNFIGLVSGPGWSQDSLAGGQLVKKIHPDLQVYTYLKQLVDGEERVSMRAFRIKTKQLELAEKLAYRFGVIDQPTLAGKVEKDRIIQTMGLFSSQSAGINSFEAVVDAIEEVYIEHFGGHNPYLFEEMRHCLEFGDDLTDLDQQVQAITIPEVNHLQLRIRHIVTSYGRVVDRVDIKHLRELIEEEIGQTVLRINRAGRGVQTAVGQELTDQEVQEEYRKAQENEGCDLEEAGEWVEIEVEMPDGTKKKQRVKKYWYCRGCGRRFETGKSNFDRCPTPRCTQVRGACH